MVFRAGLCSQLDTVYARQYGEGGIQGPGTVRYRTVRHITHGTGRNGTVQTVQTVQGSVWSCRTPPRLPEAAGLGGFWPAGMWNP